MPLEVEGTRQFIDDPVVRIMEISVGNTLPSELRYLLPEKAALGA